MCAPSVNNQSWLEHVLITSSQSSWVLFDSKLLGYDYESLFIVPTRLSPLSFYESWKNEKNVTKTKKEKKRKDKVGSSLWVGENERLDKALKLVLVTKAT